MGKKSKSKNKGKKGKSGKKNNAKKGQRRNFREMWISLSVLPAAIFFYEVLFKVSISERIDGLSFIPVALFSIVYGLIGYFFFSWSNNRRTNFVLKTIVIFLMCLPYGIEYFVFKQFKMLYDIKTITAAAGDVAGSRFFMFAVKLVFDTDGIAHLILLLFPTVLFIIKGRKWDKCNKGSRDSRKAALTAIVLTVFINSMVIAGRSIFMDTYSKQYSYSGAMENFGLLTAIRLDIMNMWKPSGGEFEIDEGLEGGNGEEETIGDASGADGTESGASGGTNAGSYSVEGNVEEDEYIDYGYSEMDIDFDAIGERSRGALTSVDEYVQSLTPSRKNKMTGVFRGKNLIMITAEAFSAEAIDEDRTPTLYRMATKGINFTDYYQQATSGTIGGEYQNIFGAMPVSGGATFQEAAKNYNYFTMGSQLDRLGYYGMAFHNNDYRYYSRHITHNSIGYSEGYMGVGNGLEEYITDQWPESDLELMEATVDMYIDHEPFNIYYMTVSGHSNYTFAENKMAEKNKASVKDLAASERVASYLAANVELDKAMEYLIGRLEEAEIADDTVIVIAPDHFPYGLDDDAGIGSMPYLAELYGYEITNYFERDHNRLIIWCGELEKDEPIVVDEPTSSLDILPTLSNLFGTEWDSRLMVGRDVFSNAEALVFAMNYDWKTTQGTYIAGTRTFTPSDPNKDVNWDGYIERINKVVTNKMRFSSELLKRDYYRHIFDA